MSSNTIFLIILLLLIIIWFIIIYSGYQIYSIINNSQLEKMVDMTTRNISDDVLISNEKIPKIIIQTWKDNNIPKKYNNDIASVKKYNPDYQYIFFTDNDIETFLKEFYPHYYETYKKLPIKIQKIDFFRYIAVYHFGGFYLDLDMTVNHNFDELLKYKCVFPIDTFIYCNCNKRHKKILNKLFSENCQQPRYSHLHNKNCKILLGQFAFGATKNNNFLKILIEHIHMNMNFNIELYESLLKKSNEKIKDVSPELYKKKLNEFYVYFTTGPDYVTNTYLYYIDNIKNDVKVLFYPKKQTFGKYAIHNCYGVWKI